MTLSYPIANDARTALEMALHGGGARTAAEARELAGGAVSLVSEWLRPAAAEREEMQARADAAAARGFVQVYEDAKGRPVLAVTFWKRQAPAKPKPGRGKAGDASGAASAVAPARAPARAPGAEKERAYDDTDDLYFSKPGSKANRKRRSPDPNQLDLFGRAGPGGDQAGAPGEDRADRKLAD
jgi:hypothetical protein